LGSGIIGLPGTSFFILFRNHHVVFMEAVYFTFLPPVYRVAIPPCPCQHLLSFFFFFDSSHPDGSKVVHKFFF
jgi:hypothetical protein